MKSEILLPDCSRLGTLALNKEYLRSLYTISFALRPLTQIMRPITILCSRIVALLLETVLLRVK